MSTPPMSTSSMSTSAFRFTVRGYQAADAPHLAQLYYDSARHLGARRYSRAQVEAWAPAPIDPADFHAQATDGRLTLVAVNADGEVIGYADLESDGHIDHLYCRPDAAGKGVAAGLLDAVIAEAACRILPLRLTVEASELARGLFERCHFVVTHRRDFEVRGVAIHNYAMERVLA